MYTSTNFKTKKEFKEAVTAGRQVRLFAPGIGQPPKYGKCCVEGPHSPQPHTWYAEVEVKDGIVVKVS
jgi:hypothetical protein